MMKVVIYTRFSPRPDAEEARSIETQLRLCRERAAKEGWTIIGEYEDRALSGRSIDGRIGLQAALEVACRSNAAILVYSLSRLARSTADAIEIAKRLEKAEANLISLSEKVDTTGAMGRFFFHVLAALAQLERELVAERTRDAMKAHQRAGRRMSANLPWGWMLDPDDPKRMIPNPAEEYLVARIRHMRAGGMGWREIGRALEESGISCRGGRWHHSTLQRIHG